MILEKALSLEKATGSEEQSKLSLVFDCIFGVFIVALCAFHKILKSREPSLIFSPSIIELGDIFNYRLKHFVIKAVNSSPNVVWISGVRVSCGCTDVKVKFDHLNPGEEKEIEGYLNPQWRVASLESSIALIEKVRGGSSRTVVIPIKANAIPGIESLKREVNFGVNNVGFNPSKQIIQFRTGYAFPKFDDVKVDSSSDFIKAQVSKLNSDFIISVAFDSSSCRPGEYREWVRVHFFKNNEDQSDLIWSIPVTVVIKDQRFAVYPPSIYSINLDKVKEVEKSLKIDFPTSGWTVESVDFPKGILGLKQSVTKLNSAGLTQVLTFSVMFDSDINDKIKINVRNGADTATIEVPVIAFLK